MPQIWSVKSGKKTTTMSSTVENGGLVVRIVMIGKARQGKGRKGKGRERKVREEGKGRKGTKGISL